MHIMQYVGTRLEYIGECMFACWVKMFEEEGEKIVYIVQLCMDSYIVQ